VCVPWSVKCGACSGTLALGTYSNGLKHPTNRAPKPCLPVAATNSVERQRSLLAISSSPRGAPRRALSGRNRKQVHIYLSFGCHSLYSMWRQKHPFSPDLLAQIEYIFIPHAPGGPSPSTTKEKLGSFQSQRLLLQVNPEPAQHRGMAYST
jgi:hypothetical protein